MLIDIPAFRWAAYGLAALSAAGAVYLLIGGEPGKALVLAGLVIGAVAFGLWHERVPDLFTLLLAVTALLNAAGYIFGLWDKVDWYDEAVHVVTPFAVVGLIAWILIARDMVQPRRNGLGYFAKVLFVGLLIGFAWEGFESAAGMAGSQRDTIVDLIADGIGSLLAAVFCLWAVREGNAR